MKVNKEFAMSSFLIYRQIVDDNIIFKNNLIPKYFDIEERQKVYNKNEIFSSIKKTVDNLFKNNDKKVALMLSGGIDSAILAALVPKGTQTFTFQPDTEGAFNEVEIAKSYAEHNSLKHEVIKISWNDYDKHMDDLMKHKGAPLHSIEPQIYMAALFAKNKGFNTLLFGEAADAVFGGLSDLLSKDYTVDDFYERYAFVNPEEVLNDYEVIKEPIIKHKKSDGKIDVHGFLNDIFFRESNSSYQNACQLANIEFVSPYNVLLLGSELDISRIRQGESKYFLREIFAELYPTFENRKKIPMPRAVDLYFKDWDGPERAEFIDDLDIKKFTGDQKWMMYCLERFLNNIVN